MDDYPLPVPFLQKRTEIWDGTSYVTANGSPLGHTDKTLPSSHGLGWDGFELELRLSDGGTIEGIKAESHYLLINLANTPMQLDIRENGCGWTCLSLPSLGFWHKSANKLFSVKHEEKAFFCQCRIERQTFDHFVLNHYELSDSADFQDPILASLMHALIATLFDEQNDASRQLASQVQGSFVLALATRRGVATEPVIARGGIPPGQLKALDVWMKERLGAPLTVEDMANHIGLSAAHFSREFKRSVGMTPWQYFIEVRLEAAREAMSDGVRMSDAAVQCGFSDQAHLTRVFKQKFGIPPSTYIKRLVRSQGN